MGGGMNEQRCVFRLPSSFSADPRWRPRRHASLILRADPWNNEGGYSLVYVDTSKVPGAPGRRGDVGEEDVLPPPPARV